MAIDTKNKAAGFEFWACDWNQQWKGTALSVCEQNIAYLNGAGAIAVIDADRCFSSEYELCMARSREAHKESLKFNGISNDWFQKALRAKEKDETPCP